MRKHSLWIIALICVLLLCSCGEDKVEVSVGQEDRVNGFMFVFDNRSATENLKNDMDARRIPQKVRWKLEKRGETTDEQDIRAIYREMSEMIVVGQTNLAVSDHGYYVEYILQDGTVTHFDFVTIAILRMGDQRYVLESDGGLWRVLREIQDRLDS
jgi:hypothetical protein